MYTYGGMVQSRNHCKLTIFVPCVARFLVEAFGCHFVSLGSCFGTSLFLFLCILLLLTLLRQEYQGQNARGRVTVNVRHDSRGAQFGQDGLLVVLSDGCLRRLPLGTTLPGGHYGKAILAGK